MKACIAALDLKAQVLLDLGVSKDDFWDALKKVMGVASGTEMSEQQWKDVTRDLQTMDFGEIVRDVLVACDVDLANLETPPGPNE